jgi:hypothetical protein
VYSAKTSEAIHMLTSIAAHQESFKDETGTYLTASSSMNSYYPNQTPGKSKMNWVNPAHPDFDNWNLLGVQSHEPVQFGYVAIAGDGGAIPDPGSKEKFAGVVPTGKWVLIKAAADQNANGVYSYFVLIRGDNINSSIHSEDEAE